ncbi:MAG: murein transglycosylase [Bacteroidetes bacterium HGW-Bacteroidetes-10]|jgi:hypothetical protein|nr:MAG: murein transglycosylase [Bacteroidetes bacterium HGW-Bacteroidetes-10]
MKLRLLLFVPVLAFCTGAGNSAAAAAEGEITQVEQVVKVPAIPRSLSFAGEDVPLNYFDVKEAIQRELMVISYWHASITYIIQLNNRYKDEIKSLLKEEGLHEDFYYLCIAESGLQPVVSPANAGGYWQFLAGTAKEYKLVVDEEVDERYNIEKSTRAAAAYFKKAYAEFGTWTMAAASFNIGISNVRYRMKVQSLKNYYDMQFPEETARYVYRALAFKILLQDPRRFGFYIGAEDLYKPLEYTEVTVKGRVENWSEFAAKHNTNFKMLKMYNQWIRSNKLENRLNRTYVVKVPKEGTREQ